MFFYLIEVLYMLAATVAIGACVPQLKQLVKSKASDELSLGTWMTWSMTQVVTLVYVISIGNILMAIVNIVWVSFYISMTLLIIHYRYKKRAVGAIPIENAAIEE